MIHSFRNFKNNIDFFLRKNITFSRKNYTEQNESKEKLFSKKITLEKELKFLEKYDLAYLKSNSTRQNYLENLYTIDLLDKYLAPTLKDEISVLDVGCKNWFYVKGEYFFFKKYSKNLILDGVELDSNRLYTNFYSRGEVAKFYTKGIGANYISGDFLKHTDNYDYLIWILPFVVEEPFVKWGLPMKYFKPEAMLKHAWKLLNKDGQIFIINQGEVEYEVQKNLCEGLNIQFSELCEIKSEFLQYEIPRYGILIKK